MAGYKVGVENRPDDQEAQEISGCENILPYLDYEDECISDFLFQNSKTLFHNIS